MKSAIFWSLTKTGHAIAGSMIHPANAILAALLGYLVKGSNAESHYTLKYRQSKPGGNAVRRATKLRGMRHLSINKGRTLAILKDRTQALAPRGGEKVSSLVHCFGNCPMSHSSFRNRVATSVLVPMVSVVEPKAMVQLSANGL